MTWAPVAWLFNLDADRELERPLGYNPRAGDLARIDAMVANIDGLMLEGDVRVSGSARLRKGYVGRAWCPTPRATRLFERAGVTAASAPPFDVVRRVNHRRFCAELGQTLEEAQFVGDLDTLRRIVAGRSDSGLWLLKRPYSFSGSGRRKVAVGALSPTDEDWARASLKQDGLQVEPSVERLADFTAHGWVDSGGASSLGVACIQRCSDGGVWLGTRRASHVDLYVAERDALGSQLERVAAALSQAGYFGPFGLDAYRYQLSGDIRFNPRGEINARYTMGWALGMGELRPDRTLV